MSPHAPSRAKSVIDGNIIIVNRIVVADDDDDWAAGISIFFEPSRR
jgi:hypothetical protein